MRVVALFLAAKDALARGVYTQEQPCCVANGKLEHAQWSFICSAARTVDDCSLLSEWCVVNKPFCASGSDFGSFRAPNHTYGGYECPDGKTINNVGIELVHIHDFTTTSGWKPANGIQQVKNLFEHVHTIFKGNAKFTILSPLDKTHTSLEFNCATPLANQVTFDSEEFQTELARMGKIDNYQQTRDRSNLYDPILHQINEWAISDKNDIAITGEQAKKIRVISVYTDDCPFIEGMWNKPDGTKRRIPKRLPADHLHACQEHDYPAADEISRWLAEQGIPVVFLVNPRTKYTKCAAVPDHPEVGHMKIDDWWVHHAKDSLNSHHVLSLVSTDREADIVNPDLYFWKGLEAKVCGSEHDHCGCTLSPIMSTRKKLRNSETRCTGTATNEECEELQNQCKITWLPCKTTTTSTTSDPKKKCGHCEWDGNPDHLNWAELCKHADVPDNKCKSFRKWCETSILKCPKKSTTSTTSTVAPVHSTTTTTTKKHSKCFCVCPCECKHCDEKSDAAKEEEEASKQKELEGLIEKMVHRLWDRN